MSEEAHEIARDGEHVAAAIEDHEGARRRRVLESNAAVEFILSQGHARGAAQLNSLRIVGAAGARTSAKVRQRELIDAGRGAIAGNREKLGACRLRRAAFVRTSRRHARRSESRAQKSRHC